MIKYYLKSNGQEVKVGDTIKVSSQTNTQIGRASCRERV